MKSVNCFSSARQKKFPRPINELTILLICRFSSRLQNSPYFCVFKYARAFKQNVWNEAENRERDWGETLKIRTVRFAYVIFVRIIRFSKPRAIPSGKISMQVVTKLSSNVFNKSFALFPTGMNC